jgi:hypothetical protein
MGGWIRLWGPIDIDFSLLPRELLRGFLRNPKFTLQLSELLIGLLRLSYEVHWPASFVGF